MTVKSAAKVALIYTVVGGLWILFSDRILNAVIDDPERLTQIQTYKGWFFVLISALLFYVLTSRALLQFDRLYQSDPLTKLLSHYRFQYYLKDMLDELDRRDGHVLVIEIDIDGFKHLNVKYGYDMADEYLQAFGRNLQEHYTADTLIARPGADRFIVAKRQTRISPAVLEEEIEEVQQIAAKTAERFNVANTVCLGLALSPVDGADVQSLLAAAASALNNARLSGPGSARFYNAELSAQEQQRQEMLARLKGALANGALSVVYQPQFFTDTREISGCEVLVRWVDPDLGFISPDIFIPLAERYRLVTQITHFVLRQANLELSRSGLLGVSIPRVSVNVSAQEFSDPVLMDEIMDQSLSDKSFLEYLQIEITESAALNDLQASAILIGRLREQGLRFSIDDFGTGYSSLAVFKDLPVNEIKIDRGFVQELDEKPRAASIVESIIHMARSFNVVVVAEGVETEAQLQRLKNCGCHEFQGFLQAKPMKINELIDFCRADS